MEINYESVSDMPELGGETEFALLENGIEFDGFTTIGFPGRTVLHITGLTPPWLGTEDEQRFLSHMSQNGHVLTAEQQ